MTIKKKLTLKQLILNHVIQKPLEKLISVFSKVEGSTFYSLDQFPWTNQLKNAFKDIQHECIKVSLPHHLPNIQDILSQEKPIAWEENWKVYFIYFFWHLVKEHEEFCQNTLNVIKNIPGVVSAFFSVLAPGKDIPEHYGPYNGVLRCHLGLIVPDNCGIKVGNDTECWETGKIIIFDDTHPHSAWNRSKDEYRVILFIDFLRPLPFFIQALNKFFYQLVSMDSDIQEGFSNLKNQKLTLLKTYF